MGAEATAMRTAILLIGALAIAYGYDQEEHETIRKSFPAVKRIDLDNVNGFVHVTGYAGAGIEMVAEKSTVAESADRLEAAKRDVKLDISQTGDTLSFYVDGPFRCNCGDGRRGISEHRRPGYRVTYDFDLKVPAGTELRLSTVNHGDIEVKNTTGDFEIDNVNGRITMDEIAGSGSAHTVNGPVKLTFARNPRGNSSFRSVNGEIDASFQPGLSADFRLKTFNGHAYTDFEVTALPSPAATSERRDGKYIYRSNDFAGVRVGQGGPELKFDTLNGSIRIINRGK
jgi:hypothetical protein